MSTGSTRRQSGPAIIPPRSAQTKRSEPDQVNEIPMPPVTSTTTITAARSILVEIAVADPLVKMDSDFRYQHVELQLDFPQQTGMKYLRSGLEETNARLNNGRRVNGNADCIRWLLEQIVDNLKT